jgi:hypothetical protein
VIGSLRSRSTISTCSFAAMEKCGPPAISMAVQPRNESLRPCPRGKRHRINRFRQIVHVDHGVVRARAHMVLPTEAAHALHGKDVATGQRDDPGPKVDANATLREAVGGGDRSLAIGADRPDEPLQSESGRDAPHEPHPPGLAQVEGDDISPVEAHSHDPASCGQSGRATTWSFVLRRGS